MNRIMKEYEFINKSEIKHNLDKELENKALSQAMNSRVKPHFIFNTLNTIAYYCRNDAATARELVLELSNYLRSSFEYPEEFISLKKEISYIKSYLYIEKVRFDSRINVIYQIDYANTDIDIPNFILQPMVENAVKYGILKKRQGGTINISVKNFGKFIAISVGVDGKPMDEKLIYDLLEGSMKDNSILANIDKRLKKLYGKGLYIKSEENKGTTMEFYIPVEDE